MKSERKGKARDGYDPVDGLRTEFHSVVETCDIRVTRNVSVTACLATHRDMPGREYTVSMNISRLCKNAKGLPVMRSSPEDHVMLAYSEYGAAYQSFKAMKLAAMEKARKLKNEIENEEELQ